MVKGCAVEQCDKLAVGDAPHEPAKGVHPRIQTLTHSEQEQGPLCLRLPLHDLVIVINLNVEECCPARVKPFLQIGELRLVLDIERHQRIHLGRCRHRTMIDMIGASLMCEAILALRPPDALDLEILPEVRHRRSLLRLHTAKILRDLPVAPFKMSFLLHNEDCLREPIHGIVHHIVHITDDAHTVAIKSPFSVSTTFPRECSKKRPDEKCRRSDVGIIAERHERKREHDDQMDREIDPRG